MKNRAVPNLPLRWPSARGWRQKGCHQRNAGCGDCCRNRRDLVLSGYDLCRIARRLGLPPRLTADAASRFAPQTLLPAVVLRPNARTGNCPF